jgi:replicative DNA helicase
MIFDKLPPQDIHIEEACLCCALINKQSLLKILEQLKEEDFYLNTHRIIFNAMRELYAKNGVVDAITLTAEVEDTNLPAEYIVELLRSEAIPTNIDSYIQKVYSLSMRRRGIQTLAEGVEKLYDPRVNVEDTTLDVLSGMSEVGEKQQRKIFHISECEPEETLKESEGISTGFKTLDKHLSLLQSGDMIIIAARTNVGKTSLALNIARNVAEKRNVLLNSREVTKESLRTKFLSTEARMPYYQIKYKKFDLDELERYNKAVERLDKLKIEVNDVDKDMDKLGLTIERHHNRRPVDLLITDYLQRYETKEGTGIREKVTHMSKRCKDFAVDLKVPHIVLSQFSREVEKDNREPRLSDLRESGAIEQDADIIRPYRRTNKMFCNCQRP